MNDVVGTIPALPGALGRAINAPIPAERLAAFRMGVGIALVMDVVFTYMPEAGTILGPGGYTPFSEANVPPLSRFQWSLCRVLPEQWGGFALLGAMFLAGISLILGFRPRKTALIAWLCSVSLRTGNPLLHNGGDQLRNFLLFVLIFSPSAELWSIPRLERFNLFTSIPVLEHLTSIFFRRTQSLGILVSGWPARLCLLQSACMYGFAALHKLHDPQWWDGSIMSASCSDIQWSNMPSITGAPPTWMLQAGAFFAMTWQLLFPILVISERPRWVMMGIGVVFHLLTAVFEIGMFPIYSICLYLPLLPWERLAHNQQRGNNTPKSV